MDNINQEFYELVHGKRPRGEDEGPVQGDVKRAKLSSEKNTDWWKPRSRGVSGPAKVIEALSRHSGRYVSDVIHCGTNEKSHYFAKELRKLSSTYKRAFMLISVDRAHVHCVHDCNFHQGACRCAFIQKAEESTGYNRRYIRGRRRPVSRDLTIQDVEKLYEYFETEGRCVTYVKVNGEVVRFVNTTTRDESGGSEISASGDTAQGILEAPVYDSEFKLCFSDSAWATGAGGLRNDKRGRKAIDEKTKTTGCYNNKKLQEISVIMQDNPCIPVQSILEKDVWLDHPRFGFMNAEDKDVRKALNRWSLKLCRWTIHDFHAMYQEESCTPTFSAVNVNEMYYSVKDSLAILIELLEFQFPDPTAVAYFVNDLYNVLERKVAKLNTILISSPPSGGKTFFFDCITGYYLNVGHMSTVNKNNTFGFQDIPGRRIVMWNEPNYSSDYLDCLKELLGGDVTNVSVKYKQEQVVNRTPFIITTNSSSLTIMHSDAFVDRMTVYRWARAPYLKKYSKKPHPLATYKLFEYYGLYD